MEWPVMDLDPLPFYHQDRVVLVGDAVSSLFSLSSYLRTTPIKGTRCSPIRGGRGGIRDRGGLLCGCIIMFA